MPLDAPPISRKGNVPLPSASGRRFLGAIQVFDVVRRPIPSTEGPAILEPQPAIELGHPSSSLPGLSVKRLFAALLWAVGDLLRDGKDAGTTRVKHVSVQRLRVIITGRDTMRGRITSLALLTKPKHVSRARNLIAGVVFASRHVASRKSCSAHQPAPALSPRPVRPSPATAHPSHRLWRRRLPTGSHPAPRPGICRQGCRPHGSSPGLQPPCPPRLTFTHWLLSLWLLWFSARTQRRDVFRVATGVRGGPPAQQNLRVGGSTGRDPGTGHLGW